MTDYIKRSDAIRAMAQYMMDTALIDNPEASDRIEEWEGNIAEPVMSTVPSADVVEVVRCKDCKYYHKEWNGSETHYYEDYWCEWVEPDENDFCSLGEASHE